MDDVVAADEMRGAIGARWPLEPVAPDYPGEVANRYRYRDGSGEIGVIASVTRPFCGGCTRARLSADGQLYTCLFAAAGTRPARAAARGASDDEPRGADRRHLERRGDRYSELRTRRDRRPTAGRDVAHRRIAARA